MKKIIVRLLHDRVYFRGSVLAAGKEGGCRESKASRSAFRSAWIITATISGGERNSSAATAPLYRKSPGTCSGTGLVLSVAGEISSSWVFNGFSKKPGKYDYRIDSSGRHNAEAAEFQPRGIRDPEPRCWRRLFLHDQGRRHHRRGRLVLVVFQLAQCAGVRAAAGGRTEPGVVRRHQLPDDHGYDRPPRGPVYQPDRVPHA